MRVLGVPCSASRFSGAALCLLLALAARGGLAAKAAGSSRGGGSAARAVVTYVAGEVVAATGKAARHKVVLGEQLSMGTRLTLAKSSRLTALWKDRQVTTALRGPKRGVVLTPPPRPKRTADSGPSSPSVVRSVWSAVWTRFGRVGRGRNGRAGTMEEPLAVRGSGDTWQMRPADEYIRSGSVDLSWHDSSGSTGQHLVIIWDASFGELWKATVREHSVAVPTSIGFAPGQRYRWVVSSAASSEASPMRWFEILTPQREASLQDELRCVQDLFRKADPPSQMHAAMGCIYESYGLDSQARAEYQTAAKTSKGYQALADALDQQRAHSSAVGSRPQVPRGRVIRRPPVTT